MTVEAGTFKITPDGIVETSRQRLTPGSRLPGAHREGLTWEGVRWTQQAELYVVTDDIVHSLRQTKIGEKRENNDNDVLKAREINNHPEKLTVENEDGTQTTLFWKVGAYIPRERHPEDNPYS